MSESPHKGLDSEVVKMKSKMYDPVHVESDVLKAKLAELIVGPIRDE